MFFKLLIFFTSWLQVMATPFAFAGHIICFLTRAWGERIAPTVREALYIAMKVWAMTLLLALFLS
jgi:hypothetical protein